MMKNGKPENTEFAGTSAAFAAYFLWGVLPIYWKLLKGVEPMQVLAHRVIWAGLFCLALMVLARRLPGVLVLIRNGRKLRLVALASLFACMNWGLYIWAVDAGRVTEAALGYFITPLLSVAFGVVFFREKADRWTRVAVAAACLGIGAAAIAYGSIPWVSLLLALSFAVYGVIKKRLGLDPLTGLTVETLTAFPFALIFIVIRQSAGQGAFAAGASVWTLVLLCLRRRHRLSPPSFRQGGEHDFPAEDGIHPVYIAGGAAFHGPCRLRGTAFARPAHRLCGSTYCRSHLPALEKEAVLIFPGIRISGTRFPLF